MTTDVAWGTAPAEALSGAPSVPHTGFMASSTSTAGGVVLPEDVVVGAARGAEGTQGRSTAARAGAGAVSAEVDARWAEFIRSGPILLLAAGVLVSLATADLLMSTAQQVAALPLTGAAIVLQVWWSKVSRSHPGPSFTTTLYYVLRWALSSVLTWLNPFMGFYAVSGTTARSGCSPRGVSRPVCSRRPSPWRAPSAGDFRRTDGSAGSSTGRCSASMSR